MISGICSLATRHDALLSNPCRDTHGSAVSRRTRRVPCRSRKINQLRAYLSYDPITVQKDLGDLMGFMLASGARIGEVCALAWAEVRLSAGTVAIPGEGATYQG